MAEKRNETNKRVLKIIFQVKSGPLSVTFKGRVLKFLPQIELWRRHRTLFVSYRYLEYFLSYCGKTEFNEQTCA